MNTAIKYIRELLEFFKGLRPSFGNCSQIARQISIDIEIDFEFKEWHIWWKRTLFSYESLNEPIFTRKIIFKLSFLVIEDTDRKHKQAF